MRMRVEARPLHCIASMRMLVETRPLHCIASRARYEWMPPNASNASANASTQIRMALGQRLCKATCNLSVTLEWL